MEIDATMEMANKLVLWQRTTEKVRTMFFMPRLNALGFNKGHFIYMFAILANPGITQEKLRDLNVLHASNISRGLVHMEKNGYITRETFKKDNRTCHLYPTAKAEEAMKIIMDITLEWYRIATEDLTETEQQEFHKILGKIAKNSENYFNLKM